MHLQIVLWAGETLIMELFDSKKKTLVGTALEAPWILSYFALGLMGLYIPEWRHMCIFIALITIPYLIFNLM